MLNNVESREGEGEKSFGDSGLDSFSIGNRRYLGSKSKLLDQIQFVITGFLGRAPKTLMDPFSGSGVVAARFAELGSSVVASDLLKHNTDSIDSFLNHAAFDQSLAESHIVEMSKLKPVEGYVTKFFGDKYFSKDNARKIDAAREYIARELEGTPLAKVALTSLIYAADKVAQTVGHYDAFFAKAKVDKPLAFRVPNQVGSGSGHLVLNRDANEVVKDHASEVLYLDPPYNSRQYGDAYHVLENISRWEKPEVFGVAQKMDRTSMKSRYSTRSAITAFRELIEVADTKLIVLSYSNTGLSRDARSNNVLTDEDIVEVLSAKGKLTIHNIDFKEFSVGRTSSRAHQERLFVCEVGKK